MRAVEVRDDGGPLAGQAVPALVDPLEARVRRALAGTSDAEPRPLARYLDLPPGLDRFFTPLWMSKARPAGVLVGLVRRAEGTNIVLTRRLDTLRSHSGQVSFPGGRRDAEDASIAACAAREAFEEIGLPPATIEVIGYLDDYPVFSRHRVTPVVGVIAQPPVAWTPSPGEVAAVFEVPLARVLDPATYERKSLLRDGLSIPYHEFHAGPYRVWGATAGMLYGLCQRVAEAG